MNTKLCKGPKCLEINPDGVLKSLDEFAFKNKATGKKQPICKECHNFKVRAHYRSKPDYYKDKARKRNVIVIKENLKKSLEYLLDNPCKCGESNPAFLEYDHVRGEKKSPVSTLIYNGHSWKTICEEIDKCEVKCVKCHRLKTLQELDWQGFEIIREINDERKEVEEAGS